MLNDQATRRRSSSLSGGGKFLKEKDLLVKSTQILPLQQNETKRLWNWVGVSSYLVLVLKA
jgi:hypothetical protein